MSALLDQIANELTSTDETPKAAKRATKAATANVPTSRGFTVKRAPAASLASAKAVMVAYLTGAAKGKYPSVGFNAAQKDKPQNFACMLAVGFVQGWTNDADGSAKVALIQQAYGLRVADRKLGFPAMASASAIVREKTMRAIGVDWIGRANAKGLFTLQPTSTREKVAVRSMRGQGKSAGDRPAKGKAIVPGKAKSERSNGTVTVSVDKALRSAAKAAERATQRAANRAKVADERKAATQSAT